jgi:hypothetical protein
LRERGVRVRQFGGDRAGEIRFTRFLRNASVSLNEMIGSACAGRDILAIQYTTVTRPPGGGGDYLHAMIEADAGGGDPFNASSDQRTRLDPRDVTLDGQGLHLQGKLMGRIEKSVWRVEIGRVYRPALGIACAPENLLRHVYGSDYGRGGLVSGHSAPGAFRRLANTRKDGGMA